MIKFYYHPSPNPAKIALFLEESGLDTGLFPSTRARASNTRRPISRSIRMRRRPRSSMAKQPSSIRAPSCSISPRRLGASFPRKRPKRGANCSRGSFLCQVELVRFRGQALHFNVAAPEKLEYAINRYNFETHRHWKILDDRLAGRKYTLGDTYTIVDMSIWGWSSAAPYLLGAETGQRWPM